MPLASSFRLSPEQVAPLVARYDGARREKRRTLVLGFLVLLLCLLVSARMAEVSPLTFLAHIGRFPSYIFRILHLDNGALVLSDVREWFWGIGRWLRQLADTILIAYLGTLIGALGAFALCFAASANLTPNPVPRLLARRLLEFCRTVPEIVFALIFVVAFGLGALPGVLALAIHTMGALGKQWAEAVENIDLKPVEGVTASGGSRWQGIIYAALPQVLPLFASYGLLRFEINVRGASVMGFVGAGGIGQDLIEAIRKFYYSDVSAILVLIIATVMVIDTLTAKLRHRLMAWEDGR